MIGQQPYTSGAYPNASPQAGQPWQIVEETSRQRARQWMRRFKSDYHLPLVDVPKDKLLCDIARILVCRVGVQDVGFVRFTDKTALHQFPLTTLGPIWRVAEAYVLPQWRNRGIYSELLHHAVAHAGVHLVHLHPEAALHYGNFYAQAGFPEIVYHKTSGMCSAATRQYHELQSPRFFA